MTLLGVNIDHVATIRQARRTTEPDPVWAAALAELGGADIITVHLREDRRHIQDRDVRLLKQTVATKLNLEMALADEIVAIALELRPDQVTLVPEKRHEVTTEGGLDVAGSVKRIQQAIPAFRAAGILVSLFIDPDPRQVGAAAEAGADVVELHTGRYANARGAADAARCLADLAAAAEQARAAGLTVNAGHGLTYRNVGPAVNAVRPLELHIGHSIISRSVFVGISQAVREMKEEIARAQPGQPLPPAR